MGFGVNFIKALYPELLEMKGHASALRGLPMSLQCLNVS